MGPRSYRSAVGVAALVGATALGIATGSLLATLIALAGAMAVTMRGPFLVKNERGALAPFDRLNPAQQTNVIRGFSLFVEVLFVVAATFGLAYALINHFAT